MWKDSKRTMFPDGGLMFTQPSKMLDAFNIMHHVSVECEIAAMKQKGNK